MASTLVVTEDMCREPAGINPENRGLGPTRDELADQQAWG